MTVGPWALDGKVAIVTGGGRGIGRATAELLAGVGARVTICARSTEQVEAVVAGTPGISGLVGHVANEALVERQAGHCLQALATPEDVARTIAFLVSDPSHPATGANLEILSNA